MSSGRPMISEIRLVVIVRACGSSSSPVVVLRFVAETCIPIALFDMVSMKAIAKGRFVMKSMKVIKTSRVKVSSSHKKRPASAPATVSDSLWEQNPNLAASLALVPLNDPSRSTSQQVTSAPVEPSKPIPRSLPPALVALKVTDDWGKAQYGAVTEYLKSLKDRFGMDTDALIAEYQASRGDKKKELAKSLCLATTTGDLRATEKDYCSDRTTSGSARGWLSGFQVLAHEKIPLCAETRDTVVATLAVLPRRAHSNPLRAHQGEFEYDYTKQLMAKTERIEESKVIVKNDAKLKNAEDFEQAKANLKRASVRNDDAPHGKKTPPSMKVTPKSKDIAKMTPKEKAAHQAKIDKVSWNKSARQSVSKLGKEMDSLEQTQHLFTDEVPRKVKDATGKAVSKIQSLKDELNKKLAKDEPAGVYQSKDYVKTKNDALTYIETFNEPQSVLKKAKQAVQLAAL